MSIPGTPTFDQLRIFLAVVETGSFAGAGRKLNRAVSVISYGVANLEAQLGLVLFEREGTKKPRLTQAGEAVLAEARTVAVGIDGLRAKVKGMLDGLEAQVSLVVDVMLPADRLAVVLRGFSATYPTVSLRLHVEALGAVAALVLDGRAVLGIAGPVAAQIEGLERCTAGSVALLPVAAPDHPLARAGRLLQVPRAIMSSSSSPIVHRSRRDRTSPWAAPAHGASPILAQNMRCCAKGLVGAICRTP